MSNERLGPSGEKRWRSEKVPAASFGMVDLATETTEATEAEEYVGPR